MMKRFFFAVIVYLGISGYAWSQPCPPDFEFNQLYDRTCLGIGGIETYPMHSPIFPAAHDDVTYTLNVNTTQTVHSIILYESVQDADTSGPIGQENFVQIWCWGFGSGCTDPIPSDITFPPDASITHEVGVNESDKYYTYKFKVITTENTREHIVSYALQGYPPSSDPVPDSAKQPVPVYAQSSVTQAFDTVFIPDTSSISIGDLPNFYVECGLMIEGGLFYHHSLSSQHHYDLRYWRPCFNFYINPLSALATSSSIGIPLNWDVLGDKEAVGILYDKNVVPRAFIHDIPPNQFSSPITDRGTFNHEVGHALFLLSEEYSNASFYDQFDPLPNNYRSKGPHKTCPDEDKNRDGHRSLIQGSGGHWKVCGSSCQMGKTRNNNNPPQHRGFDDPCIQHVYWQIKDNMGCAQPVDPLPTPHNEAP